MAKPHLTLARLHELVIYDPETGIFLGNDGVLNKSRVGKILGAKHPCGYLQVAVGGRKYLSHRLAWFMMTNQWPKHQIDHIDGDKKNNRFANLREATQAENNQNQKHARKDNKSTGLLGVTIARDKRRKRFQAQININGVYKNLGRFATAEEAHAAYLAAKRILHPFNT